MPAVLSEHPEILEFAVPISLDAYHTLCELYPKLEKTELIQGVIVEKMTESPEHNFFSNLLIQELQKLKPYDSILLVEKPLSLAGSEPEPDLAVVEGTIYDYKFKNPNTAILAVEIAKTSLILDRIKKEIYASADIPNYWIVNLNQKEIEVYSDPVLGRYQTVKNYTSGEKIPIFGSELDVSVFFE